MPTRPQPGLGPKDIDHDVSERSRYCFTPLETMCYEWASNYPKKIMITAEENGGTAQVVITYVKEAICSFFHQPIKKHSSRFGRVFRRLSRSPPALNETAIMILVRLCETHPIFIPRYVYKSNLEPVLFPSGFYLSIGIIPKQPLLNPRTSPPTGKIRFRLPI